MQRIRGKYRQFGIKLLEDDTGDIIDILITKNRDDIEAEIAMKWLQGTGRAPWTWNTLVTILEGRTRL